MPEHTALDITETIIIIFRSLLIGGIASWLTLLLSIRKFKKQSLWDRKFTSYEASLNNLADLKTILPLLAGVLMSPKSEAQEENIRQTMQRYTSIMEQLDKAIASAGLLLDARAGDILRRIRLLFDDHVIEKVLMRRLQGLDMEEVHKVLKGKRFQVDSIVEEFKVLALKDLKVKSI